MMPTLLSFCTVTVKAFQCYFIAWFQVHTGPALAGHNLADKHIVGVRITGLEIAPHV